MYAKPVQCYTTLANKTLNEKWKLVLYLNHSLVVWRSLKLGVAGSGNGPLMPKYTQDWLNQTV